MNNSTHPRHAGIASDKQKSNQFDPWIAWVTFRRCWPWALPIGVVLAIGVVYYTTMNFVPKYRAGYLLEANYDYVLRPGVMPVVRDLARTEKSLLLNSLVLDSVLTDSNLKHAPSLSNPATAETKLRKNLSITRAGAESQLLVSYTDTDPQAAADVCNAVVDAYLSQRSMFDNRRVNKMEEWLEPAIDKWEDIVEDNKDRVESLYKTTQGFNPSDQGSVADNKSAWALASALRKEMINLTFDLEIAEGEFITEFGPNFDPDFTDLPENAVVPENVQANEQTDFAPTELQLNALIERDPKVQEAYQNLERYKARVIQFEDNPRTIGIRKNEYKQAQRSVVQWSEILDKAREDARVLAMEQWDDAVAKSNENKAAEDNAKLLARRRQTLLDLDKLKSQLRIKKSQFEKEQARLEAFGGSTAELTFAQEDLKISSEIRARLHERVMSIRTERRGEGSVRSLSRATAPKTPVEKLPYKKLVMGSVVAMFVPFLFGLLWEFRTQRLTDSTMCDKHGLSVIGEIARLPSGENTKKGRRVFEESIDTLRAGLFLSVDTRNTRTIAVVSSMSGEGKSSVSSQLALSIAKATGETVLLVDADLRCPDQHDIFGLDIGPGLSGVLSGTASLSEAANKSLGDLIHVLPAGPLTSSPHRLISTEKMQEFIDNALKEYSYVVVDTAPVLSAGESLAVAAAVDATLLCVMRDISRIENVTRTTRRLEAVGATLAGTVFSGVSARQYAYRYGDYHYASPQATVTQVS